MDLKDALAAVVGTEHVDPAGDRHLQDVTENPPGQAEFVVRAGTAEEVQALVRLSHERGVALTPVVAGYNVAGLTIPRAGGVVLDLTRMDRIVELDHDAMYVLVEPGVTFAQLKAHLDAEAPELVYTYPFAPPFTSVMANALLDGLNNLSMRHGAMGKWVNGVEAVLADGEVVRTGSGGVVDRWFSRSPLPDLTGLFVSTQGTTGIVTKIALQLQPKPAHRRRWLAFAYDLGSAYAAMRALARTGSFDDVGLMTWPAAKQLFGATGELRRADDEPFAYLFVDITGATPGELEARVALGEDILAEAGVESRFEAEDVASCPRASTSSSTTRGAVSRGSVPTDRGRRGKPAPSGAWTCSSRPASRRSSWPGPWTGATTTCSVSWPASTRATRPRSSASERSWGIWPTPSSTTTTSPTNRRPTPPAASSTAPTPGSSTCSSACATCSTPTG